MNALQILGTVLAVAGSLVALAGAMIGDVAVGGATGYGGPSGQVSVGFGSAAWAGLGVAAVGVALVFAGRPKA